MRVLTWNLFHGRALPPAEHALLPEFSGALSGWAWDVALLQEVPPWWPPALAEATGAEARSTLTSRNAALPVRRWIAERRPDLIKSNGGGADAILVRPPARIVEHRAHRLRRWPERRKVHAVRLDSGVWVANLHASVHDRAPGDADHALRTTNAWAAGAPLVLGGDFNATRPWLPGLERIAGHRIDGVWARGLGRAAPGEVLDRGRLSDHAPVIATLTDPRPAGRSRAA
jgi:endonuclease/exonuclease/phosphatase family metal-dependent hydrolase